MNHPTSSDSSITLYVCVRCSDGRETTAEAERGGSRLAQAILAARTERCGLPAHEIRGVRCMSQCKRPCTVALSSPGRFTYLFGDLDPETDAHDVLGLLPLYAETADGFLRRDHRPPATQAGILGRIPPFGLDCDLVESLTTAPAHRQKEQNT